MSELEEVTDIDTVIPENTESISLSKPDPVSYEERKEAFEKEWIAFVKREITINIDYCFHLWRGMVARSVFMDKMIKLANKYFRGILKGESLSRLLVFVHHLQCGITAYLVATKKEKLDLNQILTFVESFCKESFESLDSWNSPLVTQNMNNLKPYRPEDFEEVEEVFDKEKNGGFPSWIKFTVNGKSPTSDFDTDEDDSCKDELSPKQESSVEDKSE